MSLNGLDAPEVQQAYQATLSEAGGWFLVKYTSRDEVTLLGSGQAGLSEARTAILQYEELSPLYGLVVYRRRKVLVKYVPEGTSRLLQARTTVHLRDVQDKWAPYETMLDIATADGLNDTALAAAFPLHTASPALSSNQLNEITEDSEDGDAAPKPLTHTPSISSVSSRKPTLEKRPPSQRSYRSPSFTSVQFAGDHSPVLKHKSSLSQFLVREELGHKSVTQLNGYSPAEDTASLKDDAASITSTRTETAVPLTSPVRTHTNESADYDLERYLDSFFKPKIKLGPRPVNVAEKGKRTTASAPVSSLPAGVQSRAKQPLSHPQPQYPATRNRLTDHAPSGTSAPPRLPSLHFSPQIPDIPEFLPPRPNSRGSSRSLPAPRASKVFLTPEKQRLMKALEMRKKQMRNSASVESMPQLSAAEISSPTADSSVKTQGQEMQRGTGAKKADSGIDIAHSSTAKEVLASHPQEELKEVTEAPSGSSNANLQPVISEEQADTFATNSASQPDMPEVAGEALIDTPVTDAVPTSNIMEPTVKEEQASTIDATEATHDQEHISEHGPPAELQDSLADAAVTDTRVHTSDEFVTIHKPEDQTIPTISDAQPQSEVQDTIPTLSTEATQEHDSFEPEVDPISEDPQKKRRRGLLEPLQIQSRLERHTSEHKFLSDDDFMDELQTATFEQATPVAMSKSPASPFFPPRRPSSRSAKSSNSVTTAVSTESVPLVPSVSDTLEKGHIPLELLLPSSEPQSGFPTRTPSVSSVRTTDSSTLMRKSNVSSGISARIAALAEKSTRDGSPPVAPGSRKLSANSTIAQRKSSYIDQSAENQPVPGAERRPVGRLSAWQAAAPSNPSHLKTRNAQSNNRDSVSVTARIVRVPRADEPVTSPELQASPLLFNHQRPTQANGHTPLAPVVTNGLSSKTPQGEHDSVMSPQSRDGIASRGSVETTATGRRKSFDRKSFKSLSGPTSPKKNSFKHSATMPPPDNSPDKTSRTSRFFKRISHLGKDKKKSVPQVPTITTTPSEPMSPTSTTRSGPTSPAAVVQIPEPIPQPKAELTPARAAAPHPAVSAIADFKPPRPESIDVPPPVSIGDFNVQFPDTMLWKRRWIEIDSTGHLMFTAAARHSSVSKNFNSKFHLKDLGAPFIPDIDRQEMPHSVLCDLVQGEGSLQFASEDAMSQRQLLSLLTTYHQAWTSV
ncbi:hypothetical protein D6D19_03186 [Aureobasidium pullulans]|uniref:ADF-H domain-containing protein n=1 Tax=Aureobasidium pullulans TaxID=5580 RepID=A0A4S9AAS7_AURPU|nr:hypothetical protein D6D19_03186 [Aureobasidium pullulans]